jgi:hypothetical protein
MKKILIFAFLFATLGCIAQTKSNLPIKMYNRNYYMDSKKLSVKDVELHLKDKNSAAHDIVRYGRQTMKVGNILIGVGIVSSLYGLVAEKQNTKTILYTIGLASFGSSIYLTIDGNKRVNEGIRLYNDSIR